MRVEPAFRADLISAIPHLRAFARSLTYNTIQADDLVQDTLVRAWGKQSQFEPGTNFMAWLFTILRHCYCSQQRKRSREVEDVDEGYARRIACAPDQAIHLDYKDFRAALARLEPTQREALVLVVAQDFTYEDAARVCGVATGTLKSRVSRGRARLVQLLAMEHAHDIGHDRVTMAAMGQWQAGAGSVN